MFRRSRDRDRGAIDASLAHIVALPCAGSALAESSLLCVCVSFVFFHFSSVCHFRLAGAGFLPAVLGIPVAVDEVPVHDMLLPLVRILESNTYLAYPSIFLHSVNDNGVTRSNYYHDVII